MPTTTLSPKSGKYSDRLLPLARSKNTVFSLIIAENYLIHILVEDFVSYRWQGSSLRPDLVAMFPI